MSNPAFNIAQHSLFRNEQPAQPQVVNVASVPQRSPFRYPGGKTWLVPWVREWLQHRPVPNELVEPFAGGGIISLTAAFERLASHVTMVELDPDVAAVWQTILEGDAEWLVQRILHFPMSLEAVQEVLATSPADLQQRAFLTILRNRVCHGGILAAGSGLIKAGENGKGIASRWYPETLAKRIRAIQTVRDRISFIHGDGLEMMRQYAGQKDAVFFIDPPYTAPGKRAGKRLYTHNELDHEALFDLSARLQGDFMMTYDNADSVREMAARRGFAVREVAMKGTHHNRTTELLISPAQHVL